jgi:hypothetical protein
MTAPRPEPIDIAAPAAGCTDGCSCCRPGAPANSGPTRKPVAEARRAVLRRRVRLLVAATITYTVIEAIVALMAGTVASSAALIRFGLDSMIEVASAAAVACCARTCPGCCQGLGKVDLPVM